MRAWDAADPLLPNTTLLVEASAGTGKTYQIEGLALRLVAECDLALDRIAIITFTNAATSELRDRVRSRLRDAARALADDAPPAHDAVAARLWSEPGRAVALGRLELALESFDLAPISTIHSFAQRALTELALDSGQDLDLELATDAHDVVEQLVDDELARLYVQVTSEELAVLERYGLSRSALIDVAKHMTHPTAPIVVPAIESFERVLERAQTILAEQAKARPVVAEAAARAGAELADDVANRRVTNPPDETGKRSKFNVKSSEASWRELLAHVDGVVPLARDPKDKRRAQVENFLPEGLRARWAGSPSELEARAYWPVSQAVAAYEATLAELGPALAPLAPIALQIRAKVAGELARRGKLTFDAMLSRLAERIRATGGAASPLAERLRERYAAVLVDEFQDTDDAQWTVIEAAFHGHARLFLIGDPKQAIYAFRDADVNVYLRAAEAVPPENRRTMTGNWRSDPAAVRANNALFRAGSGAFDLDDAIDYVEVTHHKPTRLANPSGDATLEPGLAVRWLDGRVLASKDDADLGTPITKKPTASRLAARACAREALAWLRGERAALVDPDERVSARRRRTPRPGDIAVLVNRHDEAALVRRELAALGIPSVAASKGSVFGSEAAGWLARFLEAVAADGRDREARLAAVTPLFGWTATELAWALAIESHGAEAEALAQKANLGPIRSWRAWLEALREASRRWRREGFARTLDRALLATDASLDDDRAPLERVLGLVDGERHATDLRHLFELLHAEERARRLGPAALAEWLRRQGERAHSEQPQRLESDARAVKIETVHVSKGLEYPIVLLPFAWAAASDAREGPLVVRSEGNTLLNVESAAGAQRADHENLASLESRREDLRKLYVALTRAKHHTVAWFGPLGTAGQTTSASALGRLLLRTSARGFDDASMPVFGKKSDQNATAWNTAKTRLEALVARDPAALVWRPETREAVVRTEARWSADADGVGRDAAHVHRGLEWPSTRPRLGFEWVVTSYTGLSSASAVPDRDEKASAYALAGELGNTTTRAPSEAEELAPRTDASDEVDVDIVHIGSREDRGGDEDRDDEDANGAMRAEADRPAEPSLDEPPTLLEGRGTTYGTWVHSVLEHLDFETKQPRSGEARDALLTRLATRSGLGRAEKAIAELDAKLPTLLATPLTRRQEPTLGLDPGFTLASLRPSDRLDELAFDLRLGQGTRYRRPSEGDEPPGARVDASALIDALLEERSACAEVAGDAWLDHLERRRQAGLALIGPLVGVLTGSIDLVFRAKGGDGVERYYLADYKTNRVGPTAGHYGSAWLAWEMSHAGYPLQSLLYTVALHQHLGTRRPSSYRYERHFGGFFYLFVRGMGGPGSSFDERSGLPLGVHAGRWPARVIERVTRALGLPVVGFAPPSKAAATDATSKDAASNEVEAP